MKTIIEHYGMAILSMTVILAILTILMSISDGRGNVGIFQVMASRSDLDTGLYEKMEDSAAVVEANSAIMLPQLSYNISQTPIKAEETIILGEYIDVVIANTTRHKLSDGLDISKNIFSFDVLSITSMDGTNYTGIYDKLTGEIAFPTAGTYNVEIFCNDIVNGKKTTATINIPIDNKEIVIPADNKGGNP